MTPQEQEAFKQQLDEAVPVTAEALKELLDSKKDKPEEYQFALDLCVVGERIVHALVVPENADPIKGTIKTKMQLVAISEGDLADFEKNHTYVEHQDGSAVPKYTRNKINKE